MQQKLHRMIYFANSGRQPDSEIVVRHKCDNRQCVNPDHLDCGTHADNVADRVKRNRSAFGSRNGRSKLTEEDVVEILKDDTSTGAELSRKYGVDGKVIRDIKKRIKWKHVKV